MVNKNKGWLFLPIFLLILVGICNIFAVMINTTASMPKGVYLKKFSKIGRGDIVAVCLNDQQNKLGLIRHYLKTGTRCHGAEPLIKQIIAIPGDRVELTDQFIAVNSHIYFYPTFYQDRQGNPLAVFPRGIYLADSYWLIGIHSAYSWDSRYWGPVSAAQIIENLKPFLSSQSV